MTASPLPRPDPAAVELAGSAREVDAAAVEAAAKALLTALGVDPEIEGLRDTPRRVAAAFRDFLTPTPFVATTFANDAHYDELVIVRDITFHSLCMHHLLPFHGVAHIGYLPEAKLLGVSKLARAVDYFSRDLQIQERLTNQIADWLDDVVNPKGLGVVVIAEHTCMTLRGAAKPGTTMVTSALRGTLLKDLRTREEFLALAHVNRTI